MNPKTVLQCDFDGTVTVEDVSFLLLDRFASGDWRKIHDEYEARKIPVGEFNRRVFGMVTASRKEMVDYMRGRFILRDGLPELVHTCSDLGIRLVIVSNGLDFYIEEILTDLKLKGVEFHAAETVFDPKGLKVRYVSPDGKEIMDGFKEAYMRLFLKSGYRTIYVGNGSSDFPAAKLAHEIYAIDSLLRQCREANVKCSFFKDLKGIAESLRVNYK